MRRMRPWVRRALETLAVILVTVIVVRAWDARREPSLKPWHVHAPAAELHARDFEPGMDLSQYLRREEEVFRQVREIEAGIGAGDRTPANRYFLGSQLNSSRFPHDWNRTFELMPGEIRGGALLIHGLTDSPYSMRPLAEILSRHGFYALCLRMPGHGTVPAGLAKADWQDWLAAVRMGTRHVRGRIGPGKPLVLVGYSNGGALVVKYSLDALENTSLPPADRLILLSPMIGVTPFAKLSRVQAFLSVLPGLARAGWLDVVPEYNPFKYNSFPAHAARQSYELTTALKDQVGRASESGHIARLPPILTFQSLADATVLTREVAEKLYDRLHPSGNGSELVLFDLNRQAYLRPFLSTKLDAWLQQRMQGPARAYTLSLVTNAGSDTPAVVVKTRAASTGQLTVRPLGLAWPPQVYSLSHVAMPFPATDPLYGLTPDPREFYGVRLGALVPRGERSVLALSTEQLLRISSDPFFPYVEQRVLEWIGAAD